jgi:fibronectin-binding autotransporter adhesin
MLRFSLLRIGLLFSAVVCLAPLARAQTLTWNSTTTDWATATNWSPNATPGAANTALFNGTGTTTVDLGGATRDILSVQFDTAASPAYTLQNGTLNFANAGSFVVAATVANTQTVNANLNLGTGFTLTNNSAQALNITGDLNANGNGYTINGSGNINLSGNTGGFGTATYSGTGTLTLSGTNDNVGLGLIVNSGTVVLAKTSSQSPDVHAVGGGGFTLNGGTLRLAGTGNAQIYSGADNKLLGGTFDLNGRSETLNSVTSDNNIGGANTGLITNTNTGTQSVLNLTGGGARGLGAQITDGAGTVGIVKTGGGLFMLGNTNNTYSGKTSVSVNQNITDTTGYNNYGGGLENPNIFGVSNQNNFGATPGSFVADHLTLNGITLFNINTMSNDGYGYSGGGSNLVIDANRGITLGSNGAEFRTGWGQNITVNSIISGTGAVLKSDGASLILNGANTYTGTTGFRNVYGTGTIQLGHRLALQNSTLITDGGTVNLSPLNNSAQPIVFGGLQGVTNAGTLTIPTNVTLQVGNNNTSTSFNGVIAGGTGTLEKIGTGALTISGANTYGAGTKVTAGTLQLGAANTLPAGGNVAIGNGTLSTGATAGFSQANLGNLSATNAAATLALGTGSHTLNFAGFDNTGFTGLTITGWTGTTGPGGSGTAGQLLFADITGLTASVLAGINFTGFPVGATLNGNQLVPVPEPSTILGLSCLALGLASWGRKRLQAQV